MTTLYAVTVDTEEEWPWDAGWPPEKPTVANIRQLDRFQQACERHGASVTYFTNHAVLSDNVASDVILSLAERPQVEIGMHIHPWNTPPFENGQAVTARQSFLANHPVELIQAKLQIVFDAFAAHELRPTSFRGGRYSSGPDVQAFLRDRGFVADASVVPFTSWIDDGSPDYRERTLEPARLPPTERHPAPLWEIPLTLGFTRGPFELWRRVFAAIETSWLGRLRLIGIADRLNLVRRAWLNFEDPLGEHMLQFLQQLRHLRLPSIVFTVHSSSLQPGSNGCYTHTENDRQRLFSRLDRALHLVSGWPEFQPATITEIARRLEERDHASSRN